MMRYSHQNLPAGWHIAAPGVYSSDDGWTVCRAQSLGYRRGFAIMRTDGGAFTFASTHQANLVSVHDTLHSALRMLVEPTPSGAHWYHPVAS